MRRAASILIVASGTRGDIEPLTVLALAMTARGMHPIITTHAAFSGIVRDAGLPFEPLGDNPSALLAGLEAELASAASPVAAINAWRRYLREGRACYRAMAERAAGLTARAGALILGLPTFWLYPAARHLRVPTICCALQPLTPTGDYSCSWLGAGAGKGIANSATHVLGMQMIWQPWRRTITAWARAALPGTSPGFLGPLWSMLRCSVPFVYGISPLVVPRPRDWPVQHVMTGFWLRDHPKAPVPESLGRFLDAPGRPLVCVTMGSADYRSEHVVGRVRAVLERDGIRAVVQSRHGPRESSDHLYVTSETIPHEWLFPRVDAVIHHGGAGTLARAIAAGRPSLALTGTGDTAWWGERGWAAGVSPRPLSARHADGAALDASIRRLVESPGLRARARALGAALRREDGPGTAARIIADALALT